MADPFAEFQDAPKDAWAEFSDATPNHSNVIKDSTAHVGPFKLPQVPVDYNNKVAMSQMAAGGPNPYQFPDNAKKAAANGVDVDTGAPYGLRSLMSLTNKPDDQIAAIRRYGADGRIGPDSGVPEYMEPKTGRWTTVNSLNPNSPHPSAPSAGTMMDATGETLGGLMGGAGVLTTAAGVSLGRMASEEGKYIIGGLLGIRGNDVEGSVDKEALTHIGVEGAKSGGIALVGGAVMNLGNVYRYARYGPNLFTKPIISGDYWHNMQDAMAENSEALDGYYQLAGNTNLKADVAQLSGHPAAHAAMGDVRRGLQSADIDYAIRGQNNLSNLQDTFDKVTKAITGPGPVDPMASGDKIVQWAAEQKAAAEAQKTLQAQASQDVAKAAIQRLPNATPEQVTQRVTQQLGLIKDADKASLDKAYGDVAVMMGKPASSAYKQDAEWLMEPQQESVKYYVSAKAKTQLETLLKEAQGSYKVDSDIAGAKLRAIPDGFLSEVPSRVTANAPPSSEDEALLSEFGVTPKEMIPDDSKIRIGNTNFAVDMRPKDAYWVVQAIKGLRSGVRSDMRNSKGWLPPDSQDMARVADVLSTDLKDSLGTTNPEVLDTLEEAESEARRFGARWRDSLLSEVANKKDGYRTPVVSSAVYHALFKTGSGAYDAGALNELSEIAKGSPDLQDTIRQSLLAVYRSQYTKDGLPTQALHNKFLDDFEGPIKTFFTPTEEAQIKVMGNLGDIVAQRSKALDKFNQTWSKSPYGQLPANSTMLAKAAFSTSDKVRGLGSFLRENNPELLEALQKDTALQLRNKVLGADRGTFKIPVLDKVLASDTGRNLQDIMPADYIEGLRTISRTAKIITSTNKQVLPADESLIHRAVRLFTGAFGTEARAYHLIRGFRERQANRFLEGLLSDPDKMRQFMMNKDQTPAAAAKSGLLSAVGATGLDED